MTTTTAKKTLEDLSSSEYKYGFNTEINTNHFPLGLNEKTIKFLSKIKKETTEIRALRLKAYKLWLNMPFPDWCPTSFSSLNFQEIVYYSAPIYKKVLNTLDEVDPEIRKTFDKLGLSLTEQKRLANVVSEQKETSSSRVATDIVFDSESITTTFSKELNQAGVILCSMSEGIEKYGHLIEKNLGRAVPIGDNYFAALNSAVFTDGSFVYIPKKVKCPIELGTYFRVNNKQSAQFERTLIVAEEGSYVSYLEGCTAPQYTTHQFHAAVVELVALKNAEIKYATVQNWYSGDKNGNGGLFNFVTKRGICAEENSKISWTQFETGSAITWKYPSCVLLGDNSLGEFFSVTLTNHYQQADSGSKMFHMGKNTKSRIISKGISFGHSINTYRGLVRVSRKAFNSRNYSQCDSVIFGNSQSNTFPSIEAHNSSTRLEHEATASKIAEEQLFYLLQRGLNIEEAVSLILSGFCRKVFEQLPLEFASEADFLLADKLEGSVG